MNNNMFGSQYLYSAGTQLHQTACDDKQCDLNEPQEKCHVNAALKNTTKATGNFEKANLFQSFRNSFIEDSFEFKQQQNT